MLKFALAFILVACASAALTVDYCPHGLKRDKFLQVHGGTCYYFHLKTKKDFADAEDQCVKEGGHLVMIKSKDINRFVNDELSYTYSDIHGHHSRRVWIGLNDLQKESHFRWVDGTKIGYENFGLVQGTHNILVHPDRFEQDCVAMDVKTGKWYDYRCESAFLLRDEHRPFVCEYKPVKDPLTTAVPHHT